MDLRQEILEKVKQFYAEQFGDDRYRPGDRIPFARRVFDEKELVNLVDASLDFWLTAGRYASDFEYEFARFMGVEYCLLVNSGSSANLVALSTLTSPKLGERRLVDTVFVNLLKNAAEASPPGGEILVRLQREGDFGVVQVRNGGAVPLNIRERFFEKYATSGKMHGTGLGTYSARLMVRAQNGSIELDTTEPDATLA